jgi:hypothetical protein
MRAIRVVAAVVTAGGILAGCSQPPAGDAPPETFPVTGEVIGRAGTPLPAGTVAFRPAGKGGADASGDIRPDGTFALRTFHDGNPVPGAAPGEYQVTVTPPQGPDQKDESFRLPTALKVERRENQFRIEQPKK